MLQIEFEQEDDGGSHRVLKRDAWQDFVFAFHNREAIGPKMMLARIATRTGLKPNDL